MEQNTIYIIVVVILLTLLILSILGTGVLVNVYISVLNLLKVLAEFILGFLSNLSKSTGEVVNGTGDAVTNTSVFGIEIVDGIIHDIGNMFKGHATPVASESNHLDIIIQNRDGNNNPVSSPEPKPSPLPTPSNSGEEKWCFIGRNDDGSNTCTKLQTDQSCQSNKVYNNQNDCKVLS